jgi:hypothetical protein
MPMAILNDEFCFGNLQFFWIETAGFCKNWGLATGVDVMLDPDGLVSASHLRCKE